MATAKVKNVTFSLPVEIIDKFKYYAKSQYITSVNAGVKEALEEYSRKIEREKLAEQMHEAANDPLFMKDLSECISDFEFSDREIARKTKEL